MDTFTQHFRTLLLLAVFCITSTSSFATTKPINTDGLSDTVASIVTEYLEATPHAGIGVTFWHKDRVIFDQGFGYADREQQIPFTQETVVALGPNTSVLTAMAILQLQEQRQLDLKASVEQYLPISLPYDNQVTLEHLLCHTSGVIDFLGGALDDVEYERSASVEALVASFAKRPLQFKPGTRQEYSTSGYVLLSLVIEAITNKRLGDYFRETFFQPFGLKDSYYLADTFYVPKFAKSYEAEENIIHPFVMPIEYRLLMGAGAVGSTLSDFVRWHSMLMKGYILMPKSQERLMKACRLSNGRLAPEAMAINRQSWYPGIEMLSSGGEINGYVTYALYFPEYDLTIGIAGNTPDNFNVIFDRLVSQVIKNSVDKTAKL